MSEHTALPWQMERTTLAIVRLIVTPEDVEAWAIGPSNKRVVAYVPSDYLAEEQKANAEYIVRAANLFPELIGLLTQDITGGEHICVYCRRITKDGQEERHLSDCAVPAVLAKAKS